MIIYLMRMKVKEFCAIEMTSYTNFKGTYYSAFTEKVTNYVENSTYKRFQNYSGINYKRNEKKVIGKKRKS